MHNADKIIACDNYNRSINLKCNKLVYQISSKKLQLARCFIYVKNINFLYWNSKKAPCCILKKPTKALPNLIHHLNIFTDDSKPDNQDNLSAWKFKDIQWFKIFSDQFKTKSLYLLHLNICSFHKTTLNIFFTLL